MADINIKSLFISGAGGFVGQRLLQQAAAGRYRKVYCLCRRPTPFLTALAAKYTAIEIICADLFDTHRYRDALADTDIAIHLAAVTGKAATETYTRVNTEGTALFVEQCRQAGVRALLFFSTIAVNFTDISGYPYARSKLEAEKIVASSNLRYTIVRPTIIFGDQSTIWKNFLKMARAPVPFVFGHGRTRIQPIHVDDLVQTVFTIIDRDWFDNATWTLGGRQVVAIKDLVRQIRQKITGRPASSLIRIPLVPLSAVLRLLEPFALGLLPFTAGQLTSFSSDGVAGQNDLMDAMRSHLRPLDDMIGELISKDEAALTEAALFAEARRLAKHITGREPAQIVLQKYAQAHRQGLIAADRQQAAFERIVLGATRIGPLFYLADAFSSVIQRTGVLRMKIILLTAILECLPDTESAFETSESGSLAGFVMGLATQSLGFGLALLISMPVFLPLRMLLGTSGPKQVKASWKN